ncbi:S8 family serine peptidase [Paenibacillus oryzae]|uniref:S8 family serine peptidase n=1 Tax=Paenibacillus oryzae TaxID=1844972 RepID=UPI000A61CF2B|nr:S8 family serine peptidase [Paenibacillus oryzae]
MNIHFGLLFKKKLRPDETSGIDAAAASWRRSFAPPASARGASRLPQAARKGLRRALPALLLWSIALGSLSPAGFAPAVRAAGAPAPAIVSPAQSVAGVEEPPAQGAAGVSQQPQSWLLKWADPEQARELRGVEVLHRQSETAVELVRPADAGVDIEEWLSGLRGEAGVSYVHPNNMVHILSPAPAPSAGAEERTNSGLAPASDSLIDDEDATDGVSYVGEAPSTVHMDSSNVSAPSKEAGSLSNGRTAATEAANSSAKSTASPEAASSSASSAVSNEGGEKGTEAGTDDKKSDSLSAAAADDPLSGSEERGVTVQTAGESPSPSAAQAAKAEQNTGKANDPELSRQAYLREIGALKAWEQLTGNTDLTIALIDTGVDLNHPDLADNLVPGINLIDPQKEPQDDNGHGTSVAGVVGAVGNNGVGVSGVLWKASIMPVKALDKWGDGTEKDLGEGILQAIRKDAKIIIMSVGLYRYSPYMMDIVKYAENKGVLLVASSGNDGVSLGSKASVKYPAAYPTVLAVGGAKPGGAPDGRSNTGPELDLIAPWNVYTTALGGGYKKEEGTSMAAPQVAAAAALAWGRNPDFSPAQIRALLRQTAKSPGAAGVDQQSGYGLIQIDKAIQEQLEADAYEPNNTLSTASVFPLGTQLLAELSSSKDEDWFVIDAPYDGKLTLDFEGLLAVKQTMPAVRISHYAGGQLQRSEDARLSSKSVAFDVKKGKQHIKVSFGNPNQSLPLAYSLVSTFGIAPDAFEPNDRMADAAVLQPKNATILGNFHQTADRDWYVMEFKQAGKLQLSVSVSTARMDAGLSLQREGQSLVLYDDHGEGGTEVTPVISVTPGKYYIRVHNAISLDASPVTGVYNLKIDFKPQLTDPNEPNDKSYEAIMMRPGSEYLGVIDKASDTDWFQFRLSKESVVSLSVTDVPTSVSLRVDGYDKQMRPLISSNTSSSGRLQSKELVLQAGVYYVKLTADGVFHDQYYRLKVMVEELESGFRDIGDHWAKDEITALSRDGIINGVGNYRFAPDRTITRAEAVAMIAKAFKPLSTGVTARAAFKDVQSSHWAADSISKGVQQGWVTGFPDGTFRPDQAVTRAEMAVMIGKAKGIKPQISSIRPFADVSATDWYAPMLRAMKNDGKLSGVQPNLFKPVGQASRASFSALLFRYYKNS